MKKSFLFLAALILMLQVSNAQIKVFTGGKVSMGSTIDPASIWVSHLIDGDYTAFTSGTSLTSCAMINGNTGYSTAAYPDYTFWGDYNTGIYHPSTENIGFSTNGVQRLRIDANGNTAINANTVSGVKFYVYGGLSRFYYSPNSYTHPTINIELWATDPRIYSTTGIVAFYNTPGSDFNDIKVKTCIELSDINAKTDIESISSGLDKINQLRGVSYYWKTDSLKAHKCIGLVAQEVEQIIPEVVYTDDSTGNKMLAYTAIIPFLIESIKEQQVQIDEQAQQIQDFKAELENCCAPKIDDGTKSGSTGDVKDIEKAGEGKSRLEQNKPNPFSDQTIIEYYIAGNSANAQIMVFDMTGKLIKSYNAQKGINTLTISNNEFTPGMYYYSLVVDGKEIDTKKMILSK